MINIENLRVQLKNKEKTIKDLVDFLKNKTEEHPFYNLLLGAGCSVTSNIRNTEPLILEWLEEHWIKNHEDRFECEQAKNYLKQNESTWFNEKHLYSCLFERKFALPRQRKTFIEKEVRDKFPSLGYAYLVNLYVKHNFNAVFTTNYDDLLSDAFLTYSDKTPVICSHESSISSITLTSQKPKIIKLHGDYLYDDLKSTVRDTETLEQNMKNKYIEFCKDSGLIIVGYAGNDRSIIDILHYLLKNDHYLNHGLYWCIRKGDSINEDILNLLMKDKAYFVEIDGFDELFANLYHKIVKDEEMPFNMEIIAEKPDMIMRKLLESKELLNIKDEYIQGDIKTLRTNMNESKLKTLVNILENDRKDSKEYASTEEDEQGNGQSETTEQMLKIINIKRRLRNKEYEKSKNDIEKELTERNISDIYFEKLIDLKVQILIKQGRKEDAIECLKRLVEKEIDTYQTYLEMARLCSYDIKKALEYVENAQLINKYDDYSYYLKAEILLNELEENFCENREKLIKDINESIDISLKYNPSYRNRIFSTILNNVDKLYQPGEISGVLSNKFETIKQQNPESITYFRFLKKIIKKNNTDLKKFESELNDVINDSNKENKLPYIVLLGNHFLDEYRYADLSSLLEKHQNRYPTSSKITLLRANYELKLNDDIDKVIDILEQFNKKRNEYDPSIRAKLIYLYFNTDRFQDALELINDMDETEKEDWMAKYYELSKDYGSAFDIVDKLNLKFTNKKEYYSNKIYLLLQLNKFQDAYNLANEFLTKINGWNDSEHFTDIINYEYSRNKIKDKVKDSRLETITKNSTKNLEKAVAYLLLGDKEKCYSLIDAELKIDKYAKYGFRKWKVFEDISKEDRFKKYFDK